MRFMLLALVALLTLSSVFGWDPGPAPGVKLKNAILYLLALGLMFRVSVDKHIKIELPAISIAFGVLIVYAIGSYLAIILMIDYPHYDAIDNALILKGVVDQLLFFLVFFYGVRSEPDAILTLKFLMAALALSHVMALADALGIMRFGDIVQREDGRVQGLFGESNQYGAFVAMSLPAILSIAFITRGVQRLVWLLAAVITAVTLIMTVSRGAFVAIVLAGVSGLILFGRYAPRGRLAMLASTAVFATVAMGALVIAFGFGELLYERLAGSFGGDMVSSSSGRTEIWRDALETMFEHPITLLTGFGWRAYWSMPFRFSPHNYYLSQWFNLGLIGLACSILLFVVPIRTARAAVSRASGVARPALMGFVIAAVAFAVATFFVDLFLPWLYFWAYAGVAMRLAVNVRELEPASVNAALRSLPSSSDRFGWRGAMRY